MAAQSGNIAIDLPALYVFGDSYIDAGNNNFLNTLANFNYTPYGMDFDGGKPTGRPTNGRTLVDFIAQAADLPRPPSALDVSEAKKKCRTGVNYGSSRGGILPSPCLFEKGHVLGLKEQVALFEKTTKELKSQFENSESFSQHMSKSLFFVHIGGNDMGLYWEFGRKSNYTVQKYSKLLIHHLSSQLQVLPLGCLPGNKAMERPKTPCAEETNKRVLSYNNRLPGLLSHLQSTLPGSMFVMGDIYKIIRDAIASPASYGFSVVDTGCCIDMSRNQTSLCAPNTEPCKERNKYVFYDPFHPTETMHFLIARRFLKDPSVSSPITLLQLMQA